MLYKGYDAFDKWKYVGKGGKATLAVNCTTDYWGHFIHVSYLTPGAENDKTLIKHDEFQLRVLVASAGLETRMRRTAELVCKRFHTGLARVLCGALMVKQNSALLFE